MSQDISEEELNANQEAIFFSFMQEIPQKKADAITKLMKEPQIIAFLRKLKPITEVKSQAFVETFNAILRVNSTSDRDSLLRVWFEAVKNSSKNFSYEQTKYLLNHVFILSNFEMTDE